MKMIICTVFDSKTEAYMRPFVMQTQGAAIRSFQDEISRGPGESEIARHPEDYSLFVIGTFNDAEGTIDNSEPPKCLARAHEVVALIKAQNEQHQELLEKGNN